MKRKRERLYLVAYQRETDGGIHIASKTRSEILQLSITMPHDAFAIFEGRCIKSFDGKFDTGRIK